MRLLDITLEKLKLALIGCFALAQEFMSLFFFGTLTKATVRNGKVFSK